MDDERLDELYDRYLDRDLSAAEESELAAMLARPECQEQWRRLASLEGKIQEELLVPAAPKKSARRAQAPRTPPYGLFALAAAGLLVAAIWILSSGPDPETPAKNDARRRAAAAADAEAKRRSREARLQELEQKRQALEAVPPPSSESPELKQKREKELQDLKDEKERTERELREAIELARKNAAPPPVAPNPTPEEKPVPPQEPPKETPRTEAMVATVEQVEGNASIVGKDGTTPAQKGQGIPAGQGIETGAKALLVLKYGDGTVLEIGEEGVLRNLKAEGGKHVRLEKGLVKARVAKQPKDQPMIFSTPHGDAKVLGTTLRLLVDPDAKKGTKLDVEEGKVELKNLVGKTVLVETGHYAVAAAGAEFVAKSTLDDPAILIAHWTFDEAGGTTVADGVGRLSGMLRNGTARVAGRFGRALGFDGVDDEVEIANHPSLEGMSEITISAWILHAKVPAPSKCSVPVAKNDSYRLTVDEGGGLSFNVATENNAWYSDGTVVGSQPMPLNKWFHVAGTYDGREVRIYMNGAAGEIKSSVSGAIIKSGSPLTLGQALKNTNITAFNGLVDDLRIYRRALTPAQIQTLAGGRSRSGSK